MKKIENLEDVIDRIIEEKGFENSRMVRQIVLAGVMAHRGYSIEKIREFSGLSSSSISGYERLAYDLGAYEEKEKLRKNTPKMLYSEKIRLAENLFEEGFSNDLIASETGLPIKTIASTRRRWVKRQPDSSISDTLSVRTEKRPYMAVEERTELLSDLIRQGFTDLEISEITGYSPATLPQYTGKLRRRIEVTREKSSDREEKFEQKETFEQKVLETARDIRSLKGGEIAESLGLNHYYARAIKEILQKHGIYFSGRPLDGSKSKKDEYLPPVWLANPNGLEDALQRDSNVSEYEGVKRRVLKAIKEHNCVTTRQITERTGLTAEEAEEVLILEDGLGIEIPRRKRRPEIDRYVEQGLTLDEIASKPEINTSSQRIGQYLKATGQKVFWKEKRRVRKVKEKQGQEMTTNIRRRMLATLQQRCYHLAQEKGEEYLLALQTFNKSRGFIDIEKIAQVYILHNAGASLGQIQKILELNENKKYGINIASILIKSAGLEANYKWNHPKGPRYKNPPEIREAVIKANDLLSTADTAHFTRTSNPYVTGVWNQEGLRKQNVRKNLRFPSQLYESVDAGFSLDESLELMDLNKEHQPTLYRIGKCLRERQGNEREIIEALDVIFPNERHDKPYR